MKAEPTALDREAGRLFVVEHGVRFWYEWWFYVGWLTWDRSQGNAPNRQQALDTDDTATIRRMLAQVLANSAVEILWATLDNNGGSYRVRVSNGAVLGAGATRGAALAAAMRQFNGGQR